MENTYIARQPIVDTGEHIFAYELLYRDAQGHGTIENGRYASVAVITGVLNKFGTHKLLGGRKAFVKIDEKFLMSDMILSVPKEFFVFSLLDAIEMHERALERVEVLASRGYELCINDTRFTYENFKRYESVLGCFRYAKINIAEYAGSSEARDVIEKLRAHAIKVIGTRIEEKAQREAAVKLGCEYFQGYYFAKPNIIENKKFEPSQLAVMKLYRLLMQDEDIDAIASEFEKNYAISVQLLRFINSGAFSFRNKISSIRHVMVLVGRKPLAQWLMLMIYSKSVSKMDEFSPLMLLVKSRTELMEALIKAVQPNASNELLSEAYFVAVLSLIDTIFEVPLEEILVHLNVSDEIVNAILKDEGLLGELYALVRHIESFDTQSITRFVQKYKVPHEKIDDAIFRSIESVNKFEEAKHEA